MVQVLLALYEAGFVQDGVTRQETVRVPTRTSPLYGHSGGELRTFGGRQRFMLPGTSYRATVGKRTTALYRVLVSNSPLEHGVEMLAALDTKDLPAVQNALAQIRVAVSA